MYVYDKTIGFTFEPSSFNDNLGADLQDDYFTIYDIRNDEEISRITVGSNLEMNNCIFSADNRHISVLSFTREERCLIMTYDYLKNELVHTYESDTNIYGLLYLDDITIIMFTAFRNEQGDDLIKMYKLNALNGHIILEKNSLENDGYYYLELSPRKNFAILKSVSIIAIISISTLEVVYIFENKEHFENGFFNCDESLFIIVQHFTGAKIEIFDVEKGYELLKTYILPRKYLKLVIHPTKDILIYKNESDDIVVSDLITSELIQTLKINETVIKVDVSATGKYLFLREMIGDSSRVVTEIYKEELDSDTLEELFGDIKNAAT